MKKNGRPLLNEDLKRKGHVVKGYCTKEQKETILSLAQVSGLTISDYILKKCLNEKTVERRIQLIDSLDQINLELHKGGNNINQLAKHANRVKHNDGLEQSVFLKYNLFLSGYVKTLLEIKSVIRSIYRELAK